LRGGKGGGPSGKKTIWRGVTQQGRPSRWYRQRLWDPHWAPRVGDWILIFAKEVSKTWGFVEFIQGKTREKGKRTVRGGKESRRKIRRGKRIGARWKRFIHLQPRSQWGAGKHPQDGGQIQERKKTGKIVIPKRCSWGYGGSEELNGGGLNH